ASRPRVLSTRSWSRAPGSERSDLAWRRSIRRRMDGPGQTWGIIKAGKAIAGKAYVSVTYWQPGTPASPHRCRGAIALAPDPPSSVAAADRHKARFLLEIFTAGRAASASPNTIATAGIAGHGGRCALLLGR